MDLNLQDGAGPAPVRAPTEMRTAGTMFAALYGELLPHRWRTSESDGDAYSLFYQRSLAMGWLDERSGGGAAESRMSGATGLWGMNDAGLDHPAATPGAGLISWFQVEASRAADDRPLPIRPFLQCAGDVTARIGQVTLSTVQVLVPVQGIDASARPPYAAIPSMAAMYWLSERDPGGSAAIEISVNSGQDPTVTAVAEQFVDGLRQLDQDILVVGSFAIADTRTTPPSPLADNFWNGPPMHGVNLHAQLAEWSCDAIGWSAEVIADSLARLGLCSPLLLTIARA